MKQIITAILLATVLTVSAQTNQPVQPEVPFKLLSVESTPHANVGIVGVVVGIVVIAGGTYTVWWLYDTAKRLLYPTNKPPCGTNTNTVIELSMPIDGALAAAIDTNTQLRIPLVWSTNMSTWHTGWTVTVNTNTGYYKDRVNMEKKGWKALYFKNSFSPVSSSD